MEILILYALLTSAAFYLGARAQITAWLWSRYPKKLAALMDCASCSGFWYGVIVGVIAMQFQPTGVGFLDSSRWWYPVSIGMGSIVWTPIVAGFMQSGFERLGTAVDIVDDGDA